MGRVSVRAMGPGKADQAESLSDNAFVIRGIDKHRPASL